jgi:hypothetical protein
MHVRAIRWPVHRGRLHEDGTKGHSRTRAVSAYTEPPTTPRTATRAYAKRAGGPSPGRASRPSIMTACRQLALSRAALPLATHGRSRNPGVFARGRRCHALGTLRPCGLVLSRDCEKCISNHPHRTYATPRNYRSGLWVRCYAGEGLPRRAGTQDETIVEPRVASRETQGNRTRPIGHHADYCA